VRKTSEKFVRLIVRRPHTYEFKNKDRNVPIPGIVFLDAQGKLLGITRLETARELVQQMNERVK
jgi:hypothetical protein